MKKNHQKQRSALTDFNSEFPHLCDRATAGARSLLADREDLVQEVVNETLKRFWQRHLDQNLPENPEAWVYTVARNEALRVAKVEDRYPLGLLDEQEELSDGYLTVPGHELSPSATAELTERCLALKKVLDAFNAAVETLDQPSSMLLEFYERGLTSEQIAFELNLKPDGVRQQWSRLLRKLLVSVRAQLRQDPLCNDLLGTVLNDEKTCRRTLAGVLRLLLRRGLEELEELVRSLLVRH